MKPSSLQLDSHSLVGFLEENLPFIVTDIQNK